MSLKKALLVAGMVLATTALAPSAASASWLHNHQPIQANANISLAGSVGFASGAGGTTCNSSGNILAEAGTTTGKLNSFSIGTHANCTSVGALAGCTISGATATSPAGNPLNVDPRTVHIKTDVSGNADLVITDLTVSTTYAQPDADCNFSSNVLHFSEITLTPDNQTTISSFTPSGNGTATLFPKSGGPAVEVAITAHGTVNVTPAKTWGIS